MDRFDGKYYFCNKTRNRFEFYFCCNRWVIGGVHHGRDYSTRWSRLIRGGTGAHDRKSIRIALVLANSMLGISKLPRTCIVLPVFRAMRSPAWRREQQMIGDVECHTFQRKYNRKGSGQLLKKKRVYDNSILKDEKELYETWLDEFPIEVKKVLNTIVRVIFPEECQEYITNEIFETFANLVYSRCRTWLFIPTIAALGLFGTHGFNMLRKHAEELDDSPHCLVVLEKIRHRLFKCRSMGEVERELLEWETNVRVIKMLD